MISKTIEKKIMEKVVRRGRGTVFFGTTTTFIACVAMHSGIRRLKAATF